MAEELSLVISNPGEGEFLKAIAWNKEEFMELVASITEQYSGVVYSEDQMKSAKNDRARLNAMKKAISDRRIEVKNAIMAPYTQFESEVKEVVALIDEPIAMIDRQIKEYEENLKAEKRKELTQYFVESAAELDGIITFDKIFDQRWLNASVSLKKAKEEIDEKISKTLTDLRSIDAFCEEKYRTFAKDHYIRTLNITGALAEAKRLEQMDRKLEEERLRKEEQRREEEERLKAEQEAAVVKTEESVTETAESVSNPAESVSNPAETAQNPVEGVLKSDEEVVAPPAGNTEVTDPFAPQDDTKQYKASFTVYGTRNQIMALKQYMLDNNIKFGKVEK